MGMGMGASLNGENGENGDASLNDEPAAPNDDASLNDDRMYSPAGRWRVGCSTVSQIRRRLI